MSDWMDFEHWAECEQLARPGYVFEVVNGEEQRLFTNCVQPLVKPWDWTSDPVRFRLVPEQQPRRSKPMPKPDRF